MDAGGNATSTSSPPPSHGLTNFPDPILQGAGVRMSISRSSGIDPTSPAFQVAQKACGSLIGKAG